MTQTSHFFLGANSGQGFQSLFGPFCTPEDHYDLAVLKGGPGCGKSTLMRRVGEAMEARGEAVEYLHCSGDPDSLDGVRIPRLRTSFVDGTAPHAAATKGHFSLKSALFAGVSGHNPPIVGCGSIRTFSPDKLF